MPNDAVPKYEIRIYWSAEDNLFLAEVPDLPGCLTHGNTPTEAAANAEEAIALWIEVAREDGMEIPAPSRHQVSA